MICEKGNAIAGKRTRRVAAATRAFTFLCQNFAWAVCAGGSTFPPGGYVNGQPPASIATHLTIEAQRSAHSPRMTA